MQVHLPVLPVEETWSDECLTWFRDKIIQISGTAIFRNREIDRKESSCGVDIYWKDSILESPFHPTKEITYFLSQVRILYVLRFHLLRNIFNRVLTGKF